VSIWFSARTAFPYRLAHVIGVPVKGGGNDSGGKLAARLFELRKHRPGANGVLGRRPERTVAPSFSVTGYGQKCGSPIELATGPSPPDLPFSAR
jgi:hypothetical protein